MSGWRRCPSKVERLTETGRSAEQATPGRAPQSSSLHGCGCAISPTVRCRAGSASGSITGTHPSHRHRRHGAQAADCDLALCDTRGRPCGRSDRRIGEVPSASHRRRRSGGVTVFVIGGRLAPRFRWVTFCRGRRLVHEASWCGPIAGPTACKVTRRSSRNVPTSDPIEYRRKQEYRKKEYCLGP